MSADLVWLDGEQVASRVGIVWSTWRGYVDKKQPKNNPPPRTSADVSALCERSGVPRDGRRGVRRHPETGRYQWQAWVIDAWESLRPVRSQV